MAEKKKTQKKKSSKKNATKKNIQLTFRPIASGAKEFNAVLKARKTEERDGRSVTVTAPLIEGLPTMLTVRRDEIIEVTPAQCEALEELGFVESDAEYKERMNFIDNLENQHPDKLSFDQMNGFNGGQLTLRDSQHKIYMDKLIRV